MNISDYSVEALDAIWDIVDSFFDFSGTVIVDTIENDLYEHSNY